MMENIDFEEKVAIDDLVLPSKPVEMAEIEINDIKQEPLQEADQHDLGKKFKLKMEENILKLCEELDQEKTEKSLIDFRLIRLLKIRQFVENIAQHDLTGCFSLGSEHNFKMLFSIFSFIFLFCICIYV